MRRTYASLAALVVALACASSCGWFSTSLGVAVTHVESNRLPNSIHTVEVKGECPEDPAGEWRLRKLYSPKGRPSLCQYIRKIDVEGAVKLTFLSTLGVATATDPVRDPPTLTVEGHEDASDWFQPLHELAIKRFDIPSSLPDPPQSKTVVRVAVLDTASTTGHHGGVSDADGHGVTMGKIIKTVACLDRPSCSVDVRYYPALPFRLKKDELLLAKDEAGNLGSSADLSAQILRATDDWLALPEPRAPLIINMSLGWSGCYESSASGRSQRVRAALEYATCNGALVLAAGGNTDVIRGCPSKPNDPNRDPNAPLHMYPGLWGGTPLSGASCKEHKLPGNFERAPLLLGIGAVDYRDHQLSITNHEADLASYGQSVAVQPDASEWQGKWLKSTGTSAATAAVSGMAALALRYHPTLSREALLKLLFSAGLPLHGPRQEEQQEFICNHEYDGGCPEKKVNRLSVCRLLSQLSLTVNHGTAPWSCTSNPAKALVQVGQPQLFARKAITSSAVACTNCPMCDQRCNYPNGSDNDDGCDKPWGRKQDPPVGCSCGSKPPGSSQLDGNFASAKRASSPSLLYAEFPIPVKHMILEIDTPSGQRRYYLGDAKANELREWLVDLTQARTARITYRMAGGSLEVADVRLGDPMMP